MLTKLNTPVGIDPNCKGDHDPNEANLFKNKYSQRYWEWPCDCTAVYTGMKRPGKEKSKSGIAKGVNLDSFEKGLFE